jgi:hypothetical protein
MSQETKRARVDPSDADENNNEVIDQRLAILEQIQTNLEVPFFNSHKMSLYIYLFIDVTH